jgi:hypothetical protein
MDKPECKSCKWWEYDRGMFTATGWTGGNRLDGYCHYEPKTVVKKGDDKCHNYENKHGKKMRRIND